MESTETIPEASLMSNTLDSSLNSYGQLQFDHHFEDGMLWKGVRLSAEEFLSKLTNKNLIPVTYHCLRDSMKLENVVKVKLGHSDSRKWVRQQKKVSIFTQPVHNN